jgi:hypothetical protein
MLVVMLWSSLMPARCLLVHALILVEWNYFCKIWFLLQNLNMFVSDTVWFKCDIAWLVCEWCMRVCLLCVVNFSGDRIKWRVCGGVGSLWVSRRRRSGTSHSRQAIYLLHTWILIFHFALFYYCFLVMHCFLYCYYSLYSNSWRLSSTSRLDIIYRDDTLDTYSTPLY